MRLKTTGRKKKRKKMKARGLLWSLECSPLRQSFCYIKRRRSLIYLGTLPQATSQLQLALLLVHLYDVYSLQFLNNKPRRRKIKLSPCQQYMKSFFELRDIENPCIRFQPLNAMLEFFFFNLFDYQYEYDLHILILRRKKKTIHGSKRYLLNIFSESWLPWQIVSSLLCMCVPFFFNQKIILFERHQLFPFAAKYSGECDMRDK